MRPHGGRVARSHPGSRRRRQVALDERAVIQLFRRHLPHPATEREILERLGRGEGDLRELRVLLEALSERGSLVRIKGGRYGLPDKMNLVVGQLRCSPRGYGFVAPERARSPDVLVRLAGLAGALHGDEVVCRVEHRKADGRLEGSVIRVLRRAVEKLLGRYEQHPGYGLVVPLEPKLLTQVFVPPDAARGARHGQVVEVRILEYPRLGRESVGCVEALVGDVADPAIDLELVLRRFDLGREFPPEVVEQAERVARPPGARDRRGREDFRADPVVTIDGEKARDFDDAVAVARRDRGYRLAVHIADVSHYVEEGSALDAEARARGTSVYFPDHVVPMLPEALSNGACSLQPGQERLTVSLVMDLDPAGVLETYRIRPGVIRSRERLTYEDVDRLLVARDPGLRDRYAPLVKDLETMGELARLLGERRRERGSLDFDLPESQLLLDAAGVMTGIRRCERLSSHRIIEEFMILANEVVARHFESRGLPFLYRVHEPPDPAAAQRLNLTLAWFGHAVDGEEPGSFRELLEKVRGRPEERLVNTLVLRALKLAVYQADNIGHFGLASPTYTHFTSPIRRYPDLVVHRLLRRDLEEAAGKGGREGQEPGSIREEIDSIAVESSRLERRAEEAEREYVERKKARFMLDKVGERFPGVISAVEAFGFFVELEEYFVEGLVHLTSLLDDYYRFDEAHHELRGESTGRRFRLADRVVVEVASVDLLRRQVDFVIAGDEIEGVRDPEARGTGPRRRRGATRRPGRRRPCAR